MKKSLFRSPVFSAMVLLFILRGMIIFPSYGYGQKVALSLSKSGFYPFQDSLYRSRYTPPFRPSPSTSTASQDLALDAKRTSGTSCDIALSVTRNWGILCRVDWATSDFAGFNGPYAFSLDYVSTYPSHIPPRDVHYSGSYDWPETVGHLKHLSFSLSGQVRFKIIQALTLELSGGLTYFSLKGEASSLGFSDFWLGGHDALFSSQYKLKFIFGPKGTLGGNLGLGIEVPVIRPVFMFVGMHMFLAPKIKVTPKLDEILNPEEIFLRRTLSEIESFMNLKPLELNPGRVQLHLGIRLRI